MIVQRGDKLLVSHRRLFIEDKVRLFIGTVDNLEGVLALVTGYSWNRDMVKGDISMKQDMRTKLVPLSSGSVMIYQLPTDLDLENLHVEHEHTDHQKIILSDGNGFSMDITDR